MEILSVAAFTVWVVKIFGMDAGVLPSEATIDHIAFRVAKAQAADASTGFQIMLPVTGVVAVLVAGQIGLQHRYIVVAAPRRAALPQGGRRPLTPCAAPHPGGGVSPSQPNNALNRSMHSRNPASKSPLPGW